MRRFKKVKFNGISKMAMVVLVAAFAFASCTADDSELNPIAKTAPVTLQFKTANSVSPKTSSFAARNAVGAKGEGDTLFIQGTNGILKITDIRFIVDEFELEMVETNEDACEGLEGQAEDDCENEQDAREEFELGMSFVQLPIGERVLEVNTSEIKDGIYDELEFEIDNLDSDEDDSPEEIAAQEAVMQAIKDAGYQNWPEEASMVIEGVFAPIDGDEVAFKAYAEAEVSIEMILNPPLDTNNGAPQAVTVNINPEKWFTNMDGTVVDLSQYDETNLYQMEWEMDDDNGFDSDVDND